MSSILNGAFIYKQGKTDCVVCVQCKKEFRYHHSTSSLSYHLRNAHAFTAATASTSTSEEKEEAIGDCSQKKATLLQQMTLDQCSGFAKITQQKKDNLTRGIALWVARDSRPIAITEDDGLLYVLRIQQMPTR
jgi:hypothetical protein